MVLTMGHAGVSDLFVLWEFLEQLWVDAERAGPVPGVPSSASLKGAASAAIRRPPPGRVGPGMRPKAPPGLCLRSQPGPAALGRSLPRTLSRAPALPQVPQTDHSLSADRMPR